MHLIPFQIDTERYNVFIVLLDDNLERMKAYDPAQFQPGKLPPEWHAMRLETVIIGYANDADVGRVKSLVASGNGSAALAYLSRGFSFTPGRGDNDEKYGPEDAA